MKPFEDGKPGFELWSESRKQIFTWNQGKIERGYWMWDKDDSKSNRLQKLIEIYLGVTY